MRCCKDDIASADLDLLSSRLVVSMREVHVGYHILGSRQVVHTPCLVVHGQALGCRKPSHRPSTRC